MSKKILSKKIPLGMKLSLSVFVILGTLLFLFALLGLWDKFFLKADNLLYLISFVLPIPLICFFIKKLGKIKIDAAVLMFLIYYLSAFLFVGSDPQYLYGGAALSLASLGIIMVIWLVLSLAFKFILDLSDNLALLILLGFLEIIIVGWGYFFLGQEWLIPFLGFALIPLVLISFPFLLLAITREASKKLDKEIK